MYGWICPRCNAVNAPFVTRCYCTGRLYQPFDQPFYPFYEPVYPYKCPYCGGYCDGTCPKKTYVGDQTSGSSAKTY